MKRNIILASISGGRSSAVMARILQTSVKYQKIEKHYIFCNTSRESDGTYDFLRRIELDWKIPIIYLEGIYPKAIGEGIKAKTVDFKNLKRDGSLFTEMIEFQFKTRAPQLPSSSQPFCSKNLKQKVARSFMRDIIGNRRYVTALGYRAEDMPKRVTYAELAATKEYICPLIQDFKEPLNQKDIQMILDMNTFDLSHSSKIGNCKICWKASDKGIAARSEVYPDDKKYVEMLEEKYNDTMFRGNRKLEQVIKEATSGTGFLFNRFEDEPCECGI